MVETKKLRYYRKDTLPTSKKVAMDILRAYGGRTANKTIPGAVEYTAYGREKEARRFSQTLDMTKEGSGRMEAFVGPYGVGKTFALALFKNIAIKNRFVVMISDISRERWFAGTNYDRQGLNLYRDLIKSTACGGQSTGAFNTILEEWYYDLLEKSNNGLSGVFDEFDKETADCALLPMYGSIRGAIFTRFREISNNEKYSKANEFFLANITKKTDANEVGAKDYIRENNWFTILNTWSHLFVKAGKKGLIVMFDQVDYLTNLPTPTRRQNYESLLTMWNDVNGGNTEYLSVCLFAANDFVDSDKKGAKMYEALDQRLKGAIHIKELEAEDLAGLLTKLKKIHEFAYGWDSCISDEDIIKFVNNKVDVDSPDCIRIVTGEWVDTLDEMHSNGQSGPSIFDELDPFDDNADSEELKEDDGKEEKPIANDENKNLDT